MIYRSRYREYEVVIQPSRKIREDDGQMVLKPGKKIQFQNGVYETKKESEISFLRKHPHFGVDFWEIDPKKLEEEKKAAELAKEVVEKIQAGEISPKDLEKLVKKNTPTTPQNQNN